jgi:chemotaxis protein CheD
MTVAVDKFLGIGEVFFGEGRQRVSTVLGSCIAVTLWHRQRHLGGMCHFMLPQRSNSSPLRPDGRYANEAFIILERAIARYGTRITEYEAKLFGGGTMFPDLDDPIRVSYDNIVAARRLLRERGIALKAEHVGGSGHRRLHFDTWTGEVWLDFCATKQRHE